MFFLGINAEEVAVIFFDIMLGVAFAFPDMLKDENQQVSTMRITVFMFVNVICMLLLKIGWDKTSFEEIGINGYWMGIIGFLFGAKAAQPRKPEDGATLMQRKLFRAQKLLEGIALADLGKVGEQAGELMTLSKLAEWLNAAQKKMIFEDNARKLFKLPA
jgi:hypothetical protein